MASAAGPHPLNGVNPYAAYGLAAPAMAGSGAAGAPLLAPPLAQPPPQPASAYAAALAAAQELQRRALAAEPVGAAYAQPPR